MKNFLAFLLCFVMLIGFACAEQKDNQPRSVFECDRSAPLLCGETVAFTLIGETESFDVFLVFNRILHNEEARQAILEAEKYNQSLLDSLEDQNLVMAEFSVKMISQNINAKFSMNNLEFETVSSKGSVYPLHTSSHMPIGMIHGIDLFSGGEGVFYVVKSIDKTDERPCLLYKDTLWISLATPE